MTADPGRTAEGTALRALRVLEAVSRPGGPHRLGRIASEAEIAKPSTHRILSSLAGAGYVVNDGAGAYAPGPRAYALSALFVAGKQGENDAVLRQFQSEVEQTVHVALRSGNYAIYVQKVDNDRPFQMASRVGGHIQLHCTAIGKVILANIPAEERASLLGGTGLPGRTANTITDPGALEAELEKVRADGYAVDDEENEETIRCLAAPLLDRSGQGIGGVSISTITFQTSIDQLLEFVPRLRETAGVLAPLYA
ncbi:MAG: helix-turn-helix domain-containing protein [Pseudonocardiaceae bacterium]|nr:helix-turn-helix domain-containing protein [Pseudonocardiaceae bacterium]